MKKRTSFYLLLLLGCSQLSMAQVTDSLNDKLTGYWSLVSVSFNGAVDINKDGVKSANALDEYPACEKDQELEILEDKTARMYIGSHTGTCKKDEKAYSWKVIKRVIRESKYVNGKRFVNDRQVVILVLHDIAENESRMFLIETTERKSFSVKTGLRDGSDSTSEALLTWKKIKKPKADHQ